MSDSDDTLHNGRTQFFFWLGVFVFPFFWSWFTLAASFSRKERIMAFGWLIFCVLVILAGWQRVREQTGLLAIGWPIVIGWVTIALWGWLFFRLVRSITFIEVIILLDVFAMVQPFDYWTRFCGRPFTLEWLLLPLFPFVLHLWVEPAQAFGLKIERKWRAIQLIQFHRVRGWWRRRKKH